MDRLSRQLVSQTIRKVHKDKTYWRRQRDMDLTQKEVYTRCVNRCSLCQRDLFGNFLFSDFLFSWWLGLDRSERTREFGEIERHDQRTP